MNHTDHQPTEHQMAALARSCLGGKKTAYLKAATSDEMKDELERRLRQIRHETGRTVSESEFVEKAVAIALFGFDHVASVEHEQLKRVAGFWSELGRSPLAGGQS